MDTTVSYCLGPNSKDDTHQYVVRKALGKKGIQGSDQAPAIKHLVTSHILQKKHKQYMALKKQYTKQYKEGAAKYTKLLAKRMKEVKERHREQIAKRYRLSETPLCKILPLNPVKTKNC
ncbi:40S ribosomal protein S6 [Fukomys damarensis]|uniref:Small ribosomal subunit protein eS6 n=1 Tax=Fukomys damarensis TaxID=885580 RepID=A0A091D650_FUKDA|nr:40S ribosomal protein S6 [Fukomys damarensis]